MGITLIVAGNDGESYFENIELPTKACIPEIALSATPCLNWDISQGPPSEAPKFAPTRVKKLLFVMKGILETGVSTGEVRRFGPGEIIYPIDFTGKGHTERLLGEPITGVLAVNIIELMSPPN